MIRITGNSLKDLLGDSIPGLRDMAQGSARYRHIPDVDDVVLVWFAAPKSYTGEDILEITFHGNDIIYDLLCTFLEKQGVKKAHPGEFSYRAVINGKMSIEKAESINDIIRATSLDELKLIRSSSSVSRKLEEILTLARTLLVDIESGIEFDEDGTTDGLFGLLSEIDFLYAQALLSSEKHRVPGVLLYGPPNCGKSTLFNQILGYERAIVSDIPGTTRDYIEGECVYRGVTFRITDSAGIRMSSESLEDKGIALTKKLFSSADLVINGGEKITSPKIINVHMKSDLGISEDSEITNVSGLTGEGVSDLLNEIILKLNDSVHNSPEIWVTSRLLDDISDIRNLAESIERENLWEVRALHIGKLIVFLEGLFGYEGFDLYGNIFSRFCVGK